MPSKIPSFSRVLKSQKFPVRRNMSKFGIFGETALRGINFVPNQYMQVYQNSSKDEQSEMFETLLEAIKQVNKMQICPELATELCNMAARILLMDLYKNQ